MPRRSAPPTSEPPDPDDSGPVDDGPEPEATGGPGRPDLSMLPIVGINRRRLTIVGAAVATVWIVVIFARQVGDASAATARMNDLRATNAALAGRVASLEREYELIQRQAWIEQQARGFGLGNPGEIAFALPADAPRLGADAPGSATHRLGAQESGQTPLDSWLSLLLGPPR